MPKTIRVDNGKPLGDPQRKSIPALALWLTAMNIEVVFNRPRRPTDNAKVERMQRTTKNWAQVKDCKDINHARSQLKTACDIQRSRLKVKRLKNKTRMEVFPQINRNPRVYKADSFCLQKAYKQLEKWSFQRRVSKNGQFSLYSQVYYLSVDYARQYVSIQFLAQTVEWQVYDSTGEKIKTIKAKNFTKQDVLKLEINQRTK